MKKVMTVIALLVLAAVPFVTLAEPASAGASTDAALALGAFAVFNQVVSATGLFGAGATTYREIVVTPPPVVVQEPPAVVYAPPLAVIYSPPPAVYGPWSVVYGPVLPPPVYYAPAPQPVYGYPYYRVRRWSSASLAAP